MRLDLPTLLLVAIFVVALLGSLLVFAWMQNRRTDALAWWGGSVLLAAVASGLLAGRGNLPDIISIELANALMLFAYGVFWTGMRRFEGRRPHAAGILAGLVLWLLACEAPSFYASVAARVVLASLVTIAYTMLAAAEVWRGRDEPLRSRNPLLVLLGFHAALYAVRIPLTLLSPIGAEQTLLSVPGMAALCFELLLFAIVLVFLLLGLTNERSEREQRLMATQDPLTGTLNRRALFEQARRLLAHENGTPRPAALLLLDIDHFKRINDRFGHSVGDQVLCRLCAVVAAEVPARARFARLGGEEFACLLPGFATEEALALAHEIRRAFAATRFGPDLPGLQATVSIGLTDTAEAGHELEALLAAADVKLYRAKRGGRNRIEHLAPPIPVAA